MYEFPALPPMTFRGLPGLLADSLPDEFGNALIDAWLATQMKDSSCRGCVRQGWRIRGWRRLNRPTGCYRQGS